MLPGLIEAHAHIGLTEEKSGTIGDDCNEMTNPVLPAIRGLDAVNPMDPAFHDAIQAGITSVMAGARQRKCRGRSVCIYEDTWALCG